MASDSDRYDRYAGDTAWTEWFEICSVAGCSPEHAAALRTEVESALFTQLARAGFSREDVGTEDPVAFFDAYFKLKGSREKPKPLKAYFAYRIDAEGLRMRDFVCGTLFGASAGRVRDIVTDWIAVHKGWKLRTVTGPDGRRHFAWENAAEADALAETPAEAADPTLFLDEEPIRRAVAAALDRISRKTGVEKPKVALLSVVTAQDISLTEPAVLDGLGVGKSRAYALRDKVMDEFERALAKAEGSDDPLFGRILLETCEQALDPAVRRRLEGAE